MRKSLASPRSIEYKKGGHGSGPWQWSGWQKHIPHHLWMRVSCWIKFVGMVPPPSGNFGLKLHGKLDNSFLKNCSPDTWEYVSSVGKATGGDGNHIILIFDSVREKTTIRFTELRLEIIDSPEAKTPIEEYVAFTSTDISREYVTMGINRRGIPTASGVGAMTFVTDYPNKK